MRKNTLRKRKKSKADVITEKIKLPLTVIILTIGIFLVVTTAALIFDLPRRYDFIAAVLCFSLITFLSGFTVGVKKRKKGLIYGFLSGLPITVIVVVSSLVLSDFKAGINIFITVICLSSASALGGVLAVNTRIG